MSEEESLDEPELMVSEESLDELELSDESVSARFAFFRLSCFWRFCSFLARFFALAFAFFFFSLSRCFLFLASSFNRRQPSLSGSMITSHIACAITPMGTSATLFFAMVSTICDRLCTHFGGSFSFPDPARVIPVQSQRLLLQGKQLHTGHRSILLHRHVRPSRKILGRGHHGSFISACSNDFLLRRRATGVHDLSGPCLCRSLGFWAASSGVWVLHLLVFP